jgi:hypothetical protein
MIWASTLQIRKHGYSGDFNFIILFVVDILRLYAIINSDAVSLFVDSSFMFLAMLNMWLFLIYSVNLNDEYHYIFATKNHQRQKLQDNTKTYSSFKKVLKHTAPPETYPSFKKVSKIHWSIHYRTSWVKLMLIVQDQTKYDL